MLIPLAILAWKCLMAAAFFLGLASPLFGGRRTIWKGLGLWGLGLGAGNAAVVMSFAVLRLQGQERAAFVAAGKRMPINDMPGFGQAMLAAIGLIYFAALLVAIGIVLAVSVLRDRTRPAERSRPRLA